MPLMKVLNTAKLSFEIQAIYSVHISLCDGVHLTSLILVATILCHHFPDVVLNC
jgi:hypothetical protein